MKWAILGAGKMTSAIFKAFHKSGTQDEFYFYSPSGVSAKKLANLVNANVINDLSDLSSFDVIFLGMKPQEFQNVKLNLSGKLNNDQIIVSILAAVDSEKLLTLGSNQVIRLMPNMLIEQGQGLTLVYHNSVHKNRLTSIITSLKKCSEVIETTDKELDFFTLFSGCAPAYQYYILKEVRDYSILHGMDEGKAVEIYLKTMKGFFNSENIDILKLDDNINAITSKGGITRAVLDGFEDHQYKGFFKHAWDKGHARINEFKKLI